MLEGSDALLRAIRLGEDGALEFKRVMVSGQRVTSPSRDSLADEIAAFANGRGGTILLGIDDSTREVIGLPLAQLDAIEGWVREACSDSVKPPADADIRKLELPDSTGSLVPAIRIDVPRSLFVHRSPGGYFRRLGSSKREMTPDVLARLFQERSQSRAIRYDESPVPATAPDDLDTALADRFFRQEAVPTEEEYRKLRLVADDPDGRARLTVASVLLCTPVPSRWIPSAVIQAVSYAGDRPDINYQDDARDIGGPLDTQVTEALHFVRRNSRIAAEKSTARRETPSFSERAVFEAVVNAVAHRDYSMAGARIRLHLFQDRLELSSPGGLPNTLTPDSMGLRQYSRNELIVSLLARCPVAEGEGIGRAFLMDRRGDGVPIIVAESQRLGARPPEYSVIDDSEVRLVIWAAGTSEA